MQNTTFTRIFIISAILGLTLVYSVWQKGIVDKLSLESDNPILKSIPEIEVLSLDDQAPFNTSQMISSSNKGAVVHFWGTWCAPCEAEIPSFLKLAQKFEKKGVSFYFLAVNDEAKKISKFLKRFRPLPTNVKLLLDNTGKAMNFFGTVKVPETYLFNSKGLHLNKFVGPQDWELGYFFDSISKGLSLVSK